MPYRRPVSVLVVVHTADRQVLLLRRSKPFDFWQSVTGSLDTGESHAAAAARELSEETGFTDEGALTYAGISRQFAIDPRWRDRFEPGTTENTEHEFRFRVPRATDVRLEAAEHSAYRWVDIDAAIDAVWSWTNRAALERLRDEL